MQNLGQLNGAQSAGLKPITGYKQGGRPIQMDVETYEKLLLRFGSFELNVSDRSLRKSGTRIKLKPQPHRVLVLLARRAGEVLTREEIRNQVWGQGTFVDFEQGLNSCIRQIRAVLNDDPVAPRFIETVPRVGYRFVAPVEMIDLKNAPETGRAPEQEPKTSNASVQRWILLGAALLLGAAALIYSLWLR